MDYLNNIRVKLCDSYFDKGCVLYGFFQGQETLTTFEWILRAIVAFFFLLTVTRVLSQRVISQLRLLISLLL